MDLPIITIYVPSKNQIIQIEEGSGCNILNKEDKEKGIVDYINYYQYNLGKVINKEVDGGQIDFDFYIRDKYPTLCTTPIIDAVLKAAYNETDLSRYLISEGDRPGLGF